MNCKECRKRLSPYLEEELNEASRQRISTHLAGCSGCSQELESLRLLLAQLKQSPQVSVPANFRQEIWRKIEMPSWPVRLRRAIFEPWYLKIPAQALATAAVVLLVAQVNRITVQRVAPQREEESEFRRRTSAQKIPVPEPVPEFYKEELQEAALQPPPTTSVAESVAPLRKTRSAGDGAEEKSQDVLADAEGRSISIQLYVRDPASAQTVISRVLAEIVVFDQVWTDSTHVTFRIPEERWSNLLSALFQIGSFEMNELSSQPQIPVILEILPADSEPAS